MITIPIIWATLLVWFAFFFVTQLEAMLRFDRATDPRWYVRKATDKGHRIELWEDIQ